MTASHKKKYLDEKPLCLKCHKPFKSESKFNRLCRFCNRDNSLASRSAGVGTLAMCGRRIIKSIDRI